MDHTVLGFACLHQNRRPLVRKKRHILSRRDQVYIQTRAHKGVRFRRELFFFIWRPLCDFDIITFEMCEFREEFPIWKLHNFHIFIPHNRYLIFTRPLFRQNVGCLICYRTMKFTMQYFDSFTFSQTKQICRKLLYIGIKLLSSAITYLHLTLADSKGEGHFIVMHVSTETGYYAPDLCKMFPKIYIRQGIVVEVVWRCGYSLWSLGCDAGATGGQGVRVLKRDWFVSWARGGVA